MNGGRRAEGAKLDFFGKVEFLVELLFVAAGGEKKFSFAEKAEFLVCGKS